jgi:hypothetical protein
LIPAFALLVLAVDAGVASGIDLDDVTAGFCGDGEFDYAFVNYFTDWTAAHRAEVDAGANDWEVPRDYTGQAFVDIDRGGGSGVWNIHRVDEPGGDDDVNGVTYCNSREIEVNDSPSGNGLRDVAAHEMGHVLGFDHTGQYDSRDGRFPLMATCQDFGTTRSLSQDDSAKMFEVFSAAAGIHSNIGFERDYTYWGFSGSHSKLIRTDTAHYGYRSLGWKPLSSTSFVYQTVTLNTEPGVDLTPRMSLRKYTAGTTTGYVSVRMRVRGRDYANPVAGCFYPNGRYQNTVTAQEGQWHYSSWGTYTPTTSWVNRDFPDMDLPTGYDAYDIQIHIYSSVKADGSYREIDIDNPRVWES